ncbi:sigma 54-interacting transcriptional regulator [Hymenobacter cheonanensis]|uniref:sigma 54-interacting transcriptional regulator n=1 Tax=Hymenobacter sp. CA2-7 TaxID=3063993 RepID=UPI0027123436|nr:sigma 54-interacting transcriptional regulator [Hymenobacter sp. CA2-7]MDO7886908.1 sigma 54-interacting transcriptional regulator [Hymenobacter sp. CA2-7]
MAHVLVSWLAYGHDFIRGENNAFVGVDETGPTVQFHRHFYAVGEYDEHIILYAEARQENLAERLLADLLRRHPGRVIQIELLPVRDIISLREVKDKVETWLLQRPGDELTLYFSPGTSVMQLAWYIAHTTLGLHTHLVQTRAARFGPGGQPELLQLEVAQSVAPVSAIIREQQVATRTASEAPGATLRAARRVKGHPALLPSAEPVAVPAFLALPVLASVYRRAGQVAQTDKVTVLIRGESGTGKEHLARTVHEQSARAGQLFLALNCAALTESTLESRLFGHQKGAFTGATEDAKGLFELADGGTVLLDEIGDISPATQLALLRVLQEGEIQPVGGQPRRVDVRVVAATHTNLEERCQQGRFRWDLYYRLAVAELELPTLRDYPLAEREHLLGFLVAAKQRSLRRPAPLVLAPETRQRLLAYPFPGNVRELENLVETLYVFAEPGQPVPPTELPRRLLPSGIGEEFALGTLEAATAAYVARAVARCGGVKRQAARLLDVDERVVAKYLRQHRQATG